jgi:2-haloacid dehalogenase
MSHTDILNSPPKAMTFDVFGTVVNWRKTVTSTLIHTAAGKTSSSSKSAELSPEIRKRLSQIQDQDWAQFAQEWRDSYKKFVTSYNPEQDEWRDIDTHHHISLVELLKKWNLDSLYTEDEVKDLSLIWHFLDPWKDSSSGLHKLGGKFITSSLSNGNQSLLKDLNEYGHLGFQRLQSSGDFKAYKPHPDVYNGAAKAMDLKNEEVAMVATHLSDLKAARDLGFKTIYVERKGEEDWDPKEKQYEDARKWVDMWIPMEEDGFLEVARRFGIN